MQVQTAMLQLVQNPLLQANPDCLGQMMQALVGKSALPQLQAVVPTPSQVRSQMTSESLGSDVHVVSPVGRPEIDLDMEPGNSGFPTPSPINLSDFRGMSSAELGSAEPGVDSGNGIEMPVSSGVVPTAGESEAIAATPGGTEPGELDGSMIDPAEMKRIQEEEARRNRYKNYWSQFKRPAAEMSSDKPNGGNGAASEPSDVAAPVATSLPSEPVPVSAGCADSSHLRVPDDAASVPAGALTGGTGPMGLLSGQPSEPELAICMDADKGQIQPSNQQLESKEMNPAFTTSSDDFCGFEAEMEAIIDLHCDASRFVPTTEDVKAALLRKTTLDLQASTPAKSNVSIPSSPSVTSSMAPSHMPNHTAVIMDLGGFRQHVWVPMTADEAVRAGLTLSNPSPVRSEGGQLASSSNSTVSATPAAGPEVPEPTVPEPTPAVAPAVPDPTPATIPAKDGGCVEGQTEKDKKDNEAERALKNGYMRFHRSVNGDLA